MKHVEFRVFRIKKSGLVVLMLGGLVTYRSDPELTDKACLTFLKKRIREGLKTLKMEQK